MKFNVYGRKIEIIKSLNGWDVFYIGNEGKKRTAHDIIILIDLKESEIVGYLEDLLHEWATAKNHSVFKL
ncbi:MAG: hypothetical protein K8S13_24760 [Desulfobacula sp.]|uniref:DUF7661 family protein n=1 Tax=Desulfobacula sp. TaxID=2593537 RepID=UPI0025B91D09|nr:hypothetical protein [Desulfobacula sp.]MCD4723042.1 hypothetical protein [Desulfobacula sp.]